MTHAYATADFQQDVSLGRTPLVQAAASDEHNCTQDGWRVRQFMLETAQPLCKQSLRLPGTNMLRSAICSRIWHTEVYHWRMFCPLTAAYEIVKKKKVKHAVNMSNLGLTVQTLKPVLCLTLAVICLWPLSKKITACFHSERSAEHESHKVQRGRGFRRRDNGLSGCMQRGLDQQEAHPVTGCTSHKHALSMQVTAWAQLTSSNVTVADTNDIKSCSFSGSLFCFRSLLEKVYTSILKKNTSVFSSSSSVSPPSV